jgi:hypothetical protein
MNETTLYLDVLPMFTAEEVGGFSRAATRRRGVAVAATLSGVGEFKMFRQDACRKLVEHLRAAKLVVGYNCIKFDYELIRGQVPFRRPKTLDLFHVISEASGGRVSFKDALSGIPGRAGTPARTMAGHISSTWAEIEQQLQWKLEDFQELHHHLVLDGRLDVRALGWRRKRKIKVSL